MGHKLHNRIEIWKKLLLDFGKRNRLINFLEGKRSNVRITTPSFDRLWELVVANEKEIVSHMQKKYRLMMRVKKFMKPSSKVILKQISLLAIFKRP